MLIERFIHFLDSPCVMHIHQKRNDIASIRENPAALEFWHTGFN